jgi:hypothetical protein
MEPVLDIKCNLYPNIQPFICREFKEGNGNNNMP